MQSFLQIVHTFTTFTNDRSIELNILLVSCISQCNTFFWHKFLPPSAIFKCKLLLQIVHKYNLQIVKLSTSSYMLAVFWHLLHTIISLLLILSFISFCNKDNFIISKESTMYYFPQYVYPINAFATENITTYIYTRYL